MTSVEQHKLIRELRDYENRMTREEQERFDMYRKRDKDDEDLDRLSKVKLKELYEKYVVSGRPRGNPLDALFGGKPE
ncbi:MAG: hypothetical protein RRA94_10420 [Bacteroidota bacterium]|nr:hypothetical protein [Bacteroidota bacterium]